MTGDANSQNCFYAGEIAAYLDGELSSAGENAFDQHLTRCAECQQRLNSQKLLLCALDVAFKDEKSFELPPGFAKSIVVRAESDVSGLRSRDERRRAFVITGGLLTVGMLVGIIGKRTGLLTVAINNFGRQFFAVLKILIEVCYDFVFGFTVILRVVGRKLNSESTPVVFVLAVLLIVSFVLLSRLLFKFHRAEQSG